MQVEADLLRRVSVTERPTTIIVLGIGQLISTYELNNMASWPYDRHAIIVRSYSDLPTVESQLSNAICASKYMTHSSQVCVRWHRNANQCTKCSVHLWMSPIFTALHGMQTRSSDENICPSVCPSVKRVNCDKTEEQSFNLVFWEKIVWWVRPLLHEILGQPAPVGAKSPILNR